MAITYVAGAGANFASSPSPAAVDEPAGCADGDILLIYFVTDTVHDTTGTPPTGWTKIAEVDNGTDSSMSVFWKRRSGAESATWTNIFGANEAGRWVMLSYRGCFATGDPQDVAAVTGPESGTAWDTAAIVPTTDSCMLVAAFGCDPASDPYTFAWAGGITERIDSDTTPTGQNALLAYIAIGDKIVSPAASTSLGGTSSVSDTSSYVIIALKPAAAGVTYQPRHPGGDFGGVMVL